MALIMIMTASQYYAFNHSNQPFVPKSPQMVIQASNDLIFQILYYAINANGEKSMQINMTEKRIGGLDNSINSRRYDVDALRVLAFAILILYHSGMFYVQDWGWHVKSQYQAQWLQIPMMFFNQWRMALLFIISGMATFFLVKKTGSGFLGNRFKVIGVPLLFGMFVIVSPQAYFEARFEMDYNESFWLFWQHYVGISDWPESMTNGSDYDLTWNHLWYLPYMLLYSIVLIPFAWGSAKLTEKLTSRSIPFMFWLLVPLLPLMLLGTYLFPLFPYIDHSFFEDGYAHGMYFTFFFLGFVLMHSKQVWQQLASNRWLMLAVSTLSFIVFITMNQNYPEQPSKLYEQSFLLVLYVNRWFWILTLLALAHTYLNRPARWLSYSTGAVFSWYILHQTITVSIGALVTPFSLGAVFEPIVVIGGTVLGCVLIHHFIVRPLPVLHLLMGHRDNNARLNAKTIVSEKTPSQSVESPIKIS